MLRKVEGSSVPDAGNAEEWSKAVTDVQWVIETLICSI